VLPKTIPLQIRFLYLLLLKLPLLKLPLLKLPLLKLPLLKLPLLKLPLRLRQSRPHAAAFLDSSKTHRYAPVGLPIGA
jgi:hypothetical protein